jgi:hypothetical protein
MFVMHFATKIAWNGDMTASEPGWSMNSHPGLENIRRFQPAFRRLAQTSAFIYGISIAWFN